MASWDDWAVLLSIWRTGSLAGAAKRVGVDATTVGRRLAALERSVGLRLFERTSTGLRPSRTTEELLPKLEAVEAAFFGIERQAAGADLRLEGVIRLTCSESVGTRLVAPAVPRFCARYPRTGLRIITSTRSLALLRREADVALRMVEPKESALIARRAGQLAYGLYASPAMLKAYGKIRDPRRLGHLPVLGLEEELADLPETKFLAEAARESPMPMSSNSLLSLMEAAKAGAGVAVLPCMLGDSEPGLRRAWPEPLGTRCVWLVIPAELQRARRVRELIAFLLEVLEANGPLLRGERPRA